MLLQTAVADVFSLALAGASGTGRRHTCSGCQPDRLHSQIASQVQINQKRPKSSMVDNNKEPSSILHQVPTLLQAR